MNANFEKYFGIENVLQSTELMAKLLEPMFTLKDIQEKGVTAYTLFHWNKEGLIWRFSADSSEDRSWNRYSFIEFIWIKIVISLRAYGISFKIIRNLMKELTETISFYEIMSKVTNQEKLISLIPQENREDFLNWINSDESTKKESPLNIGIPVLLLFVAKEIVHRESIQLLFNVKGKFLLFVMTKYYEFAVKEEYSDFFHHSYIAIPISELLKDFISGKSRLKISGKLELLTQREVQIIQTIRDAKDLKSINIRFDAENQINLIEETRIDKVNLETRLLEMILKNGYQNIEIITENGNIVRCLNTRKIKLKSDE